jgi:hypothetical protein
MVSAGSLRPQHGSARLNDVRSRLHSVVVGASASPRNTRRWEARTGFESASWSSAPATAPGGNDRTTTTRSDARETWTLTTRTTRCRSAALAAWSTRSASVNELPLVVMSASLVKTDGRFLAFALNAVNSTGANLCAGSCRRSRLRRLSDSTTAGRAGCLRVGADVEQLELAVFRHRVFVLLPQEALLNEDVDVRWAGTGTHLPLPQADRPDVLFAAEHELRFLLALGLMAPCRQGRGHQNRHHGEGDEQCRHRVAALSVLTP